ncbi:hypothetical protein [Azonexus sp.]|uniref:hypothetical protein n=1 Tax=Azonexus sp. TaxID=1872668 RepID=UPI0027B8DFFC|nr:hypothetical protein [Azonexus sp.]
MSDKDLEAYADSMLNAALGGLTPHQALLKASLADSANVDERAAAIAKNRERALKLLAAIEKSQD